MDEIIYLIGDATTPDTQGPKIISHICNDIGAWGNPYVLWLGKRLIGFFISCHSPGSRKRHNALITLIISDLSCLQF